MLPPASATAQGARPGCTQARAESRDKREAGRNPARSRHCSRGSPQARRRRRRSTRGPQDAGKGRRPGPNEGRSGSQETCLAPRARSPTEGAGAHLLPPAAQCFRREKYRNDSGIRAASGWRRACPASLRRAGACPLPAAERRLSGGARGHSSWDSTPVPRLRPNSCALRGDLRPPPQPSPEKARGRECALKAPPAPSPSPALFAGEGRGGAGACRAPTKPPEIASDPVVSRAAWDKPPPHGIPAGGW